MELQHRSIEIETRAAGNRTVELSFSSETPVDRGDYLEVLSHDPADVDLSRLNDGHPLLLNHDPDQQVGVIESASISGGKGRAKVRFGSSQKAQEVFNDVKDGIRRLVSVGYKIVRQVSESRDNQNNRVLRFAWAPFECSLVAIPADITVGVGRSHHQSTIKIMSDNFTTSPAEIRAIARNLSDKIPNVGVMAERAISSGHSVEQFRAEAFSYLPQSTPIANYANPLGQVAASDWKRYSLSRAILAKADGGRIEGFEGEMDREIAIKYGKPANGFYIPDEAFRSHIAGTPTLGGFLVQNTVAGDEFIEFLRNRSQVLNLGARVLNLNGPTFLPRQNASGAAYWVAETTASTLTAVNFQNLTLTPKAITCVQQYSKVLLMTSNPSIDSIVRDDMLKSMATAIDLAALHGGGGTEPLGIAGTTGINTVTLSANGLALGNATAYPMLVSMETSVANSNADVGALSYLMRPGHRGVLRGQSRFANTDTPLWNPLDNKVNGYRAEVTAQILTNLTTGTATTICSAIFFGDFSSLIVASFGSTDLTVDNVTLAGNRVIKLYADRYCDVGLRTPQSFCVAGEILTT